MIHGVSHGGQRAGRPVSIRRRLGRCYAEICGTRPLQRPTPSCLSGPGSEISMPASEAELKNGKTLTCFLCVQDTTVTVM